MTDCPNAEMRDRLPDLLHGRLETSARAVVMAHVEQCEDCRAEVALLREARIVLSPELRVVDVAAISRVVIEKTRTPGIGQARRSRWMDWRIAASVAVLLVGAGSVTLLMRSRATPAPVASVADTPAVAPNGAGPATGAVPGRRSEPSSVDAAVSAELSAAAAVSDLSENELRALLGELDQIDVVPSAEPEQVNVRVALPDAGSSA